MIFTVKDCREVMVMQNIRFLLFSEMIYIWCSHCHFSHITNYGTLKIFQSYTVVLFFYATFEDRKLFTNQRILVGTLLCAMKQGLLTSYVEITHKFGKVKNYLSDSMLLCLKLHRGISFLVQQQQTTTKLMASHSMETRGLSSRISRATLSAGAREEPSLSLPSFQEP